MSLVFKKSIIALFAVLCAGVALHVGAVPLFDPGETLNPPCGPLVVDCTVNVVSDIVDNGDGTFEYTNEIGTAITLPGSVERGAGVPVSTPTASDALMYIDTDTGNLYSWDGVAWNAIGAGSTPSATPSVYNKQATNYRLARELDIPYVDENTQTVIIPEFDDAGLGGSHGLVYIDQYDVLFSNVRSSTPGFIRFNDPADLSNYTYVPLTGFGNYDYPEQIQYSTYKDKVYMIVSDLDYTEKRIRIYEIDPVTNAFSLVIDELLTGAAQFTGPSTFAILDDHLYVGQGNYNPKLMKFNLDTYSLVDTLVISDPDNAIHAIETDGEKLFLSSTWNSTSHFVARVNPTTMALEEQAAYALGSTPAISSGFTDDMLVWGDYIYVVSEAMTENFIWKIDKNNLSQANAIQLDVGQSDPEGLYNIFSDGTYIWYSGPGTLGSFDPATGRGQEYDVSDYPGSSINEMASDGVNYYLAGYDSYPVSGNGYITRKVIFDEITNTFTLGYGGVQTMVTDFVTGQTDFERAGPGTVSRFISSDGNCTIDPAVVGGISCSSDETLKKDITPIEGSQFDKVASIQPREYHWKNEKSADTKTRGFIAQNVRDIFPDLVDEDQETGKLRMSYAGLTVPLVGAVQELGLRIAGIEALNDFSVGDSDSLLDFMMLALRTAKETTINGIVKMQDLRADRIEARQIRTQQLCVEDLCISRDEFKQLLENAGVTPIESEATPAPIEEPEVVDEIEKKEADIKSEDSQEKQQENEGIERDISQTESDEEKESEETEKDTSTGGSSQAGQTTGDEDTEHNRDATSVVDNEEEPQSESGGATQNSEDNDDAATLGGTLSAADEEDIPAETNDESTQEAQEASPEVAQDDSGEEDVETLNQAPEGQDATGAPTAEAESEDPAQASDPEAI